MPVVNTITRPAGVPEGARLVTMAQLADEVARSDGSLRLGPRGSYLRVKMSIWPFGIYGQIKRVTHGVSSEHGGRVFGLWYCHGVRRGGDTRILAMSSPEAADRQLWIWTLDDTRKKGS